MVPAFRATGPRLERGGLKLADLGHGSEQREASD
jgi:hypothetical protein